MFTEEVGGEAHKTQYAYDRDNRVTDITYDGDAAGKISYGYDGLGRLKTRTISGQTGTYYYEDGGYSANSSSPLVALINQPKISFRYAYDTRGNIVSEQRGTLTTTYAYDALGQLVRVNDPHENATWVYNYDRGGNITSKVKYAYTTGALGAAVETIPYVYGDANWKDKLTSYNGTAITYDAIGNPLNDGTWMYTWQAGRQLKQMNKPGTTVQFKYDHNGLRVGKEVNGVETKYVLHGKLITHMTVGEDKLHFFYDAQSRPAKVNFNGTMYTYLHNLQGDVVGILDNAGDLVVEYKYDAWGKPLSTTGSLAGTLGKRNPFRYRGYVYDEETGLYYLKSRYFSSRTGRFLILDEYVIGSSGDVLNHNAYIYCGNNPAARVDEDGNWFLSCLIGAAVSVAFEYVNDVVENFQKGERGLEAFKPDSPASHYIAAGVGGFIAAIPGGTYVRTAVVGAISNVADKAIRGDIKSSADVIETAMIGGYSNAAGRYISEYVVAGKAVKKINKQNRATRKQYARKIYGGKNSKINTNLRRLAVEAGPAYADAHKYRYGAYSSMASTGLINYVMIK